MRQRINLIILFSVVSIVAFFVGLFSCKMWLQYDNVGDLGWREKQTESNFELDAEYEERISSAHSNFELDAEYEERISSAHSNVEICSVNDEYKEKWRTEANIYYDKVLIIASEDLRQALIAEQKEWESFVQSSIKEQREYLEQVYRSGTIVPILLSKYEYEIQRERAVELYNMYDALKDSSLPEKKTD